MSELSDFWYEWLGVGNNIDQYSDTGRWRGMGYDLEDNVADILIAGVIMHKREKMGDAALTGSLHVRFSKFGK